MVDLAAEITALLRIGARARAKYGPSPFGQRLGEVTTAAIESAVLTPAAFRDVFRRMATGALREAAETASKRVLDDINTRIFDAALDDDSDGTSGAFRRFFETALHGERIPLESFAERFTRDAATPRSDCDCATCRAARRKEEEECDG